MTFLVFATFILGLVVVGTARGMELSEDDKIRQHATQQLRTYWEINYKDFDERFGINCKEYFSKEIDSLKEMHEDGLIEILDDCIKVTEMGKDFAQFITNYFDVYDPPNKPYNERLAVIKNAKDQQKVFLDWVNKL